MRVLGIVAIVAVGLGTITLWALEGAEVVLFGGGQPRAMFDYACHKAGIDAAKIKAIVVGGAADMDRAFRDGQGDYIQQQGPFPQQLAADGVGQIVAQVGPLIGACAFSSAAATREWLASDQAEAFMRAYRKTRVYMNEAAADEIAAFRMHRNVPGVLFRGEES